jgi:phage baseplate assembly protein W
VITNAAKEEVSSALEQLNPEGLESTKIPSKVREKVEAALDRLGPSVTVGDVSAAAGVSISQAEAALNALACDTQGTLEVWEPRLRKASCSTRLWSSGHWQAVAVCNCFMGKTVIFMRLLQVSSAGDVIYSLPSNFRSILRNKSLFLRLAPGFKTAQNVAGYVARVSFGTALVASVAVVWAAVFALLSTQQSDRDDRR